MQELLIKFGQTIRELRIENNLSQEKLAEYCGLHRTYISSVELGKRNVSLENIGKISSALNTSITELFNRIENIQQKSFNQ